jgi:putative SOS response-associated peptidase YedK
MCGRYFIRPNLDEILAAITALGVLDPDHVFEHPTWTEGRCEDIKPTDDTLVVRWVDDHTEAAWLRWGLIPFWHKLDVRAGDLVPGKTASGRWRGPSFPTINARSDGLASKAAWRGPWKRGKRCVLLASGFWEWSGSPKRRFTLTSTTGVVPLAGLRDRWQATATEAVLSPTMIAVERKCLSLGQGVNVNRDPKHGAKQQRA